MDRMTLKGNWNQLKGKVRERWGKFSDDELETLAGNRDQLVGKIQEHYGKSREEAERDVSEFERQYNR